FNGGYGIDNAQTQRNQMGGGYKRALTIAEVLISMAEIGVLAAITIPLIVENHKKITAATQLKKFYSNINQAVRLHNTQSGEDLTDFKLSSRGSTALLAFYNETIAPYMIDIEHKIYDWQYITVAFNDGSGFFAYAPDYEKIHIIYCVQFSKCKHGAEKDATDGRNTFLFTMHFYRGDVITAWDSWHTDPREYVLRRCKEDPNGRRNSCSRLIEMDGWTVKPDYPWRKT
ncbi:type II secretion system protein, partial [bacterium]|nr:type II secretion system protein [bacterium]